MFVKICGLSTPEAVDAALCGGADALGFVFSESPRRISPDLASELCEGLRRAVIRVAVMRHPTAAAWNEVRAAFTPDWLQTDREDFEALELGDCEALPVFRTGGAPPARARPSRMLFESAHSGSGVTADWAQAARIARTTRMILAGGLTSDNVTAAVRTVRPWGVDVSSGVEVVRGAKDPAKIREFIARARAAE